MVWTYVTTECWQISKEIRYLGLEDIRGGRGRSKKTCMAEKDMKNFNLLVENL